MGFFTDFNALRTGFPLLLLVCASGLVAPRAAQARETGRIQVAATLPVVADLIENVGGDSVQVTDLLGGQGDVHTFEPDPSDFQRLRDADILYEIGLELEPWLDRMVRASKSRAKRIRLSDGIDRITLPAGRHQHSHQHHQQHPELGDTLTEAGMPDPHIWMDPIRATYMVVVISETLSEVRPDLADHFENRAMEYIARIRRTEREARGYLNGLREDQRKLVTYHDNFRYFAEHFELDPLASILGSLSTDHFDPSAGQIRDLVSFVQEESVAAIFPEYGEPGALSAVVAREAGITLAPPLYGSRFDRDPTGPVQNYLDLILYNAKTIAEALGQDP